MDPLFLSQVAQPTQQRIHLVAMGRQAVRQAEILNQRRELPASADAQIEDHEFWQSVTKKFHGIPTVEQLRQSWDQQEA